MMQTSAHYEKKISELQAEINYLHKLLDDAKIPYKEFVANISYEDDLRQAGMESDQGSRIIPINLTPKHAAYFKAEEMCIVNVVAKQILKRERQVILHNVGIFGRMVFALKNQVIK